MKEIPIFKAEASVEGLAERIQANRVIAYTTKLEQLKDFDIDKVVSKLSPQFMKAHAGIKDEDLYFTKSILVSSNWNLNDDVFDKYETWAARHTPAHKPTNLDHDEFQLVGHMTDNWVIDSAGNIVADSTPVDDVPDLFHIVNAAVIYTTWKDDELIERTEKLIAQIEAGEKFVSMECLFSNFSYAVISPEGKYHTVARTEKSAFLTKHLRAYGGTGEYQGYKLGRLPRNFTFSGKGYVDNPGNPDSVILSSSNSFAFSKASQENPFFTTSGVSIIEEDTQSQNKDMETSNMSENIYKDQAEKFEAEVVKLRASLEEMREQNSKAGVEKLQSEVETLKAQVTELTKERDELSTAKTELETAKAELETSKAENDKKVEELQAKVDKAEADIVTANRIAQLVEAGASSEDAAAKVAKFTNLSDDQWSVVAETMVAAFPPKDEDKDKKDKDKKDKGKADKADDEEEDSAEANANDESLENAKANEELDLAAQAGQDDKDTLVETRKELQSMIAARLGVDDEESDN